MAGFKSEWMDVAVMQHHLRIKLETISFNLYILQYIINYDRVKRRLYKYLWNVAHICNICCVRAACDRILNSVLSAYLLNWGDSSSKCCIMTGS